MTLFCDNNVRTLRNIDSTVPPVYLNQSLEGKQKKMKGKTFKH